MKAKTRLAFLIIVLFQLLILVGLTGFNEAILAFGKTVVLQTVPVDPRDIFRGDYVVLRYEISTLGYIPGIRTVEEGFNASVRLEPRDDVWQAVEVARVPPDDWDIFITGKAVDVQGNSVSMEYGIEAYFVPEGEGLAIQRARDIKVYVSLDGSGKGVIKSLLVDGKTFRLR